MMNTTAMKTGESESSGLVKAVAMKTAKKERERRERRENERGEVKGNIMPKCNLFSGPTIFFFFSLI